MLALTYLGLATALGDLLCRRFYRFVSTAHRWAAATLVGILLSTWFTYQAADAFSRTNTPLLWADILFFVAAVSVTLWLSRKRRTVEVIKPRAPGSSRWDWITLGILFTASCVLLIGTLYVNKQGQLRLSETQISELAPQVAIAQSFALHHDFPTGLPRLALPLGQFLFFFQAGNLDFLGLNLAWSLDVLSVLALTSALALVLALGELLFTSRFVGRLGATLFLLYGSLGYLPILTFGFHHEEPWGFAKQIAFISERHLPFLIGLFLVILIFVIDQYRLTGLPADARSETNGALRQLKETGDCPPAQMDSAPKGITSLLIPAKSYVFSGLLLAAIPVWAPSAFISAAMSMCCLLVAYGFWWLLRLKTARTPGRVLAGTLMACIIAIGVSNLIDVYGSSLMTIDYKQEPLVKGLGFRKLTTYKLPASSSPDSAHENSSTPAVTAFEGGQGNGRGQFDSPRGIATDSTGNIFIADTGNGRIEKFSPSATFLTTIAIRENAEGKLGAPNGIAIDKLNNVYVADASKHVVERLAPNGTVLDDWEGPPPGFYGPRRIAIGPDDSLYIVDQGRTRIVKLNLKGQVLTTWGSGGSGDGQFNDHTSVAVDPATNKVYVADPRNSRIQIFDSNGNFLTKWSIPEWKQPHGFEDLAIDSQRSRLYASSMHMNRILSFNLEGIRLGTLTPQPPDKLDQPSAIALAKDKLLVLDTGSARVSVIPLPAR